MITERVIRCWTASLGLVLVVDVTRDDGRHYEVKGRMWGALSWSSVLERSQASALRIARALARSLCAPASEIRAVEVLLREASRRRDPRSDCDHTREPNTTTDVGSKRIICMDQRTSPPPRGKLTPRRVQQLRDGARIGYSQRDLAAHFRLSQSTVCDVLAGRLHAEVPDVPAAVLVPAAPAPEQATIKGVPHRERLFALLSDPRASFAEVLAAIGEVPGVDVKAGPAWRDSGCRNEGSILVERATATSAHARRAIEITRESERAGLSTWSAWWVDERNNSVVRRGPAGVISCLSLLEVQQ